MRVQIPYPHLDDNQEPHVTVAAGTRFQIALLEGAAAPEIPADSAVIEWLICRRSGPHALEFRRHDLTLGVLDFRAPRFDLPDLIGIMVPGEESESRALQERWAECFPAVELDFIALPRPDTTLMLQAALDAVGRKLLSQRAFSGRAALDLAVYRREFERLQRSFSRLEEFVSQYTLEAPLVLFEYPALLRVTRNSAAALMDAADDAQTVRVLQSVPVDSLGVAGFALHLHTPLPAATSVCVTLYAPENDRVYGLWTVEAAQAAPGWVNLALSRAIDEPALSLRIAVEMSPGLDPAVLALGEPHPYPEFCARIEGGAALRAPLALRVFGGLPGTRVPVVSGACLPTGSSAAPVTFIPPDLLATAYQVFPPPDRDRNKFVIYDASSSSVTVHPHEGGIRTIARLDLRMPPNAWRLSAQISLAHELANATRFALSAVPGVSKGADGAVIEGPEESSMWFSGWVELAPLEKKMLSVLIPPSEAGVLTVYLLTQQAVESSPDYAWARFESFTFNSTPNCVERPTGSWPKSLMAEQADVIAL